MSLFDKTISSSEQDNTSGQHRSLSSRLGATRRSLTRRLGDLLFGRHVIDADLLEELMRAFVALRVKPYYLHHPDKARGTARFRLPLAEGRAIAAALGDRLSGIARPTYVLDIPGGFGKVPILSERVRADGTDWLVEDRTGRVHRYTDTGMP